MSAKKKKNRIAPEELKDITNQIKNEIILSLTTRIYAILGGFVTLITLVAFIGFSSYVESQIKKNTEASKVKFEAMLIDYQRHLISTSIYDKALDHIEYQVIADYKERRASINLNEEAVVGTIQNNIPHASKFFGNIFSKQATKKGVFQILYGKIDGAKPKNSRQDSLQFVFQNGPYTSNDSLAIFLNHQVFSYRSEKLASLRFSIDSTYKGISKELYIKEKIKKEYDEQTKLLKSKLLIP